MDRVSTDFLSLVRSALWGMEPDVRPSADEWPLILRMASQQTVMGLVSDAVAKLPADRRPAPELWLKLHQFRVSNIRSHALLNTRLAEVLDLFRSAGLRPVLFKGQGLAANYPDPTARQCGDLDIYIGEDDYLKACEVAIKAFGAHDCDAESKKHYHLRFGEVDVEVHRIAESLPGFKADRKYQEWTRRQLLESELRQVEINGISVDVPPVAFDAIYILNHTWHHFVNGGIGLRQVCDWTMYLHRFHDCIDIRTLEQDLRDFSLLKVWKTFAYIAVNYLGLPQEECPLYEEGHEHLADKVLDRILSEGNFGRYYEGRNTPRPEAYTAGKLHSFRITTGRYLQLFPLFPGIALRYYGHFIASGVYHYFKGLK